MVNIGKRDKLGKRYVSRIIRFAFLAPRIVEQIVDGRQPPDFTAESLLRGRSELPLAWDAQQQHSAQHLRREQQRDHVASRE